MKLAQIREAVREAFTQDGSELPDGTYKLTRAQAMRYVTECRGVHYQTVYMWCYLLSRGEGVERHGPIQKTMLSRPEWNYLTWTPPSNRRPDTLTRGEAAILAGNQRS